MQVYQDLDVDAELQRGLLPGCLALSAKLGPAIRDVAFRTAGAARFWFEHPAALQVGLVKNLTAIGWRPCWWNWFTTASHSNTWL